MPEKRTLFGLSLLANHFPALHGLRVLGILSVIQIHLSFELVLRSLMSPEHIVYRISQRIWFGMDLFFLLSGFLIGTILLGDASRGTGVLRFYARRSFRIIPLYYVVLTLLAWAAPLDPLQRANLPREYLYLTNYSDTAHVVMFWGWSLCVEEHFYLAVPLLMLGVRLLPSHRARIVSLTLLWLSGAGARWLIVLTRSFKGPEDYFRYVYIPTHARYDILIAGVLLAYLLKTEGDRLRAWMQNPRVRAASLGFSALLVGALMTPPPFRGPPAWTLLATGTITGMLYLNLVIYLVTFEGVLARLLGARIFLRLATLGYGVYLVHMPLVLTVGIGSYVTFVTRLHLGQASAFLLAVGMVFLVSLLEAYVLHLLVEKPSLYLRDRLAPAK